MNTAIDFDIFLEEIRNNFVVSHIMTKIDDLIYYENVKNKNLTTYDILPLKDLKRYWNKNKKEVLLLTPEDIISSKLDLLTLIDYFKDKDFYFVKYGKDIDGFVHYSDLKKHPVRVLFYILISNLEINLREIFDGRESVIKQNIGRKRLKEINELINEDKSKNQELNIFEYLYLTDFLNVLAKDKLTLKKIKINSRKQFEKFNSLNDLRNWVAHPVRDELKGKHIKTFLLEQKEKIFRLNEHLNYFYVY